MATHNYRSQNQETRRVEMYDYSGSESSSSGDEGPELPKSQEKPTSTTTTSALQKTAKCKCSKRCWWNWTIVFWAFVALYIFYGLFFWAMIEPILYDTYTTLVVWGILWVIVAAFLVAIVIWRQIVFKRMMAEEAEKERLADEERMKPAQVKLDEDNQI